MLEKLLGASSAGLQFTSTINIENLRKPIKLDELINMDDEDGEDDQLTPIETHFRLPSQAISDSLNTLVRLLVLKLPRNHLTSFS